MADLSKIPLSNATPSIKGVAGYYEERDDDDTQNEAGISKGLSVQVQFTGKTVTLFGAHLISEGIGQRRTSSASRKHQSSGAMRSI